MKPHQRQAIAWLKGFASGRKLIGKLTKKTTTLETYAPRFRRFCKQCKLNPDELLKLKEEGMKHVGDPTLEFQAEELVETTLDNWNVTLSVKRNMWSLIRSFFKHNRRPLAPITDYVPPKPTKRKPTLQDVEEMIKHAYSERNRAFVAFLASAPFRLVSVPQLVWGDLKPTGRVDIPIVIEVDADRLKGHAESKRYKTAKQCCFLHKEAHDLILKYKAEAKSKGYTITDSTPLFISYSTNSVKTLTLDGFRAIIVRTCRRAWGKQKRFSPHDFRDFFYDATVNIGGIEREYQDRLMGWVFHGVRKHYFDPPWQDTIKRYEKVLPLIV